MKCALVVAGIVVLCGLPGGVASGGQDALGGYVLDAASSGLGVYYDQPGSPIPAKPTGEMSVARSIARMSSGPSGYALSSALWPGEVAANAPPFLASEVRRQSGGQPFPDLAGYPVRAETFHPQGPADAEQQPAPGIGMRSHTDASTSTAETYSATSGVPGLLTTGAIRSTAGGTRETGRAVSAAMAVATDVSILNGVVSIDSVTSTGRASSDGRSATLGGEVRVAGLRIADMPLEISEHGIFVRGQPTGPGSSVVNQIAQQTLSQAGVTLLISAPIDTAHGAAATRSVGGLLVRFEAGALPKAVRDRLAGSVDVNESLTIVIAALIVSAVATTAAEVAPIYAVSPPVKVSAAVGPPAADPTRADDGVTMDQPAPLASGVRRTTTAAPTIRAVSSFRGIPPSLVGVALAGALALARVLRRVADAVLVAPAARCLLEE